MPKHLSSTMGQAAITSRELRDSSVMLLVLLGLTEAMSDEKYTEKKKQLIQLMKYKYPLDSKGAITEFVNGHTSLVTERSNAVKTVLNKYQRPKNLFALLNKFKHNDDLSAISTIPSMNLVGKRVVKKSNPISIENTDSEVSDYAKQAYAIIFALSQSVYSDGTYAGRIVQERDLGITRAEYISKCIEIQESETANLSTAPYSPSKLSDASILGTRTSVAHKDLSQNPLPEKRQHTSGCEQRTNASSQFQP